tara:strand:- start:1031 stop:1282 length:252 start_codon:yes stop_codon:yes gene_type:complete
MTEEVNAAAEEAAPQLTLGDISTMVQIIDLCSKRGGFEGQELEAVGGLRSRVVKFLEANQPKDGEAPEGDVPVAEEVVEAEEA